MKKRITFLMLVMSMTLLLSGCFKLEAGITIKPDGSGEIYNKTIVSEEFQGDLNEEGEDVFKFNKTVVTLPIEETHDNVKYKGELQKQSFNTLSELAEMFTENMEISVDKNIATLRIKNDNDNSETDIEMVNMMKLSGVTTEFKITVPEIIETNGDIKGNTVTWDFMQVKDDLIVKFKINDQIVIPEKPIEPDKPVNPEIPTDKQIKVTLNDEILLFPDQQPVIVNGRTLVPIRTISEALEMNVFWDNNTRTAEISKDGKFIYITIDKNEIKLIDDVSTKTIQIDVPAKVINGRTMVPLRAISEIFDIQVDWNAENFTAELYK